MRTESYILLSNGLALLELIVGYIVDIFGFGYQYINLGIHAVIGILLFAFTLISYIRIEERFMKRLLLGTIVLIIIAAILGFVYILFGNIIISIIHFIFALGVLSNLSVGYGFMIGKRYR
ncbi:MAG: hypothetical protein QXV69_03980 [Sulfolobaceae archaeon]